MFVRIVLSAALASITCLSCSAQTINSPSVYAGSWVVHLGTRTLLMLNLHGEGDHIQGSLDRPAHMADEGNTIFANLRGGIRHDLLRNVKTAPGELLFQVTDLTDDTAITKYELKLSGDTATLSEADALPSRPLHLQRVSGPVILSTDWEPNRTYSDDDDTDTNSTVMKALYDEDQRVRTGQTTVGPAVTKTDEQRRVETRKLLADGSLHTGIDYEEAAIIFQHGTTADDYLLAHTLAMVATSKGDPTAIWIAAATLDRYLRSIGQKQIYGTQIGKPGNADWTQEPFNKQLISESLREQLGVQPQSVNEERLKWIRSQSQSGQSK
jgi:hypothetical protein